MLAQMRIVGGTSEAKVPEVNRIKDQERSPAPRTKKNFRRKQTQQGHSQGQRKECGNCGYQHPANRELCPAKGMK